MWYNFVALCLFLAYSVFARNTVKRQSDLKCYGDLGCFVKQPHLAFPQDPSHINTQFELYNRGAHSKSPYTQAALQVKSGGSSWASHVDPNRETKIIIHGFIDNGHTEWLPHMKDELLKKDDYDVIIVNWGGGSRTEYNQASANTFLVGAQVAQMLKYLHDNRGVQYSHVHIIGHSLGAQTASHVGFNVKTIGRITGLDPADPNFSGKSTDLRLDASDAALVDIIHTDASKFTLVAGYGVKEAVGDIDFYPNEGVTQPGCAESGLGGILGGLVGGSLSGAAHSVSCSHSRSHELFTESINSPCKFYAHKCPSAAIFEGGRCLGCPSGGCPIMGFDAVKTSARGSFYLSTSGKAPFCGNEYFVEVDVSHSMRSTRGEFLITLVGSKGSSEEVKFDTKMQYYHHDEVERHVIAVHKDIGTLQSIRLHFVRLHFGSSGSHEIRVHSVKVQPASSNNSVKFCAHDTRIQEGRTATVSSHSGC